MSFIINNIHLTPLKPCPLCGREVIMYERYIDGRDHWDENEYYICCEPCDLRYGSIIIEIRRVNQQKKDEFHNELAVGWNKRRLLWSYV